MIMYSEYNVLCTAQVTWDILLQMALMRDVGDAAQSIRILAQQYQPFQFLNCCVSQPKQTPLGRRCSGLARHRALKRHALCDMTVPHIPARIYPLRSRIHL
jgi:hypothetical protein